MIEVLNYLDDREEEFGQHLLIARMLEARVDELVHEGDIRVDIRHINTLKSGLLIHLYNIVEATMTRTLATVGQTVLTESPRGWTNEILTEWVRAEVWGGEERIGEAALKRLTGVSETLVSGRIPAKFVVKGEPGSWDDKSIRKVAKRLGCKLKLPGKIGRKAYEGAYRNKSTALEYVAQKRNAIAHGVSTFENGANDLTLKELENLAARILPYLRAVSESYQEFLESKRFLAEEEADA